MSVASSLANQHPYYQLKNKMQEIATALKEQERSEKIIGILNNTVNLWKGLHDGCSERLWGQPEISNIKNEIESLRDKSKNDESISDQGKWSKEIKNICKLATTALNEYDFYYVRQYHSVL